MLADVIRAIQDCVRVYQAVQRLPELCAVLESYSGQHSSLVEGVFIQPLKVCYLYKINISISVFVGVQELNEDFSKYTELVETTVDLSMVDHHQEFVIKPSFDDTLTSE